MKPLALFHANCPDGYTAAFAAWTMLKDDADYREVNYGQEPPLDDAKGRRVLLLDFSYPRAKLDALAAVADRVEIYDHHKTAEADLRGWAEEAPATRHVVFDMDRSGAGIAWDELVTRTFRPLLIAYVEDRDLWRWALPKSREVSEYLFSLERTFENWASAYNALAKNFEHVAEIGAVLLRTKRVRVAKMCEQVRWLAFGDLRIPVVNVSWDFSEVGEYLHEQFPDAPCGGYYFDRADQRQWGFRVVGGTFDVSALCKTYGGGGHRAAAGFQSAIGWLP